MLRSLAALFAVSVLLTACAEDEGLPDEALPPPGADLYVDMLAQGGTTTLTIEDAPPNQPVVFGGSDRAGAGPCLPAYGGLCLGIVRPLLIGRATTDAAGRASIQVNTSSNLQVSQFSFQAVVGAGNAAVASQVLTRQVQPGPPQPLTQGRPPAGFMAQSADAVVIDGDIAWVTVSYSGGCAQHDFRLEWNGMYATSLPVQVSPTLLHNPNGDLCEAWITETVRFDLGPIRDGYGAAQPEEIVVHLGGQTESLVF